MVETSRRPLPIRSAVALLSIHPEYVNLIKDGVKRVEFRRVRFARDVAHIVIYATSPIQRVVGFCAVEQVVRDTPANLWSGHGKRGGVSKSTLMKYLANLNVATALLLGEFHSIPEGFDLTSIGVERPPQSFQYLKENILSALRDSM